MERIKTIEIIINGTEKVKTDWSTHKIEVDPTVMFSEMNKACTDLANTLHESRLEDENES